MGKPSFPTAATSTERSRAARYRRKAVRDGKLKRAERDWLRRYDSERKRLSKGIGRPTKALPQEVRRAGYLRAKRKRGTALNAGERSELKAYEKAKTKRRGGSRKRRGSAKSIAIRIRTAVVQWLDPKGAETRERWYMEPKKGRPGIGIADAEWKEPALPPTDREGDMEAIPPGDFPAATGHRANVKVRWSFFDDNGDERRSQWLSIIPMTSDFAAIPNDLVSQLQFSERPSLKTREGESIAAITGVSIYASPPR